MNEAETKKKLWDYLSGVVTQGSKWPKDANGIATIPYTFNPDSAVKRLEKGDIFAMGGNLQYSVSKENSTLLQTPPDYLQHFAEQALAQWQEAAGGGVVFTKVDDLIDGRGIVISTCGTYVELGRSAFAPRRYDSNGIFFSITCFPSNYKEALLENGGVGAQNYVKYQAIHELGHAIGFGTDTFGSIHPHENPFYKEVMLKMGTSGCDKSIMAYPTEVCEPFMDCMANEETNKWKCYEIFPTKPGQLDIIAMEKKYGPTFEEMLLNEAKKFTKPWTSGFAKGVAVEAIEQITDYSSEQSRFICEGAIAAMIAAASPHTALTYMAVTNLPRAVSFVNKEIIGNESSFAESMFSLASSVAGFASAISGQGIVQTTLGTVAAVAGEHLGGQAARYLAEKANKVLEV